MILTLFYSSSFYSIRTFKHILSIFLLFTSSLFCFSQGGWKKKYYPGNSIANTCRNVFEAPNGNLIMVGLTYDSLNHFNYLTLLGADSQGNLLWRKNYGNSNFEYLDNILAPRAAICQDGSAFYHTLSVRYGSKYVGVLIKFNYNGDTLWQKIFSDPVLDVVPQGICKSIDGGLLITGFVQGGNGSQCLLIKTSLNGNQLWRKDIHKATLPDAHDGKAIVQDSVNKKITIVGYQYIGNSSSWDACSNILILDSIGNTLVQTTLNNTGGGGFSDVIQLKDGNFLTSGSWLVSSIPKFNGIVVKFDSNGNKIWSKKFDAASTYNWISLLHEEKNGDLILLGRLDTLENYFLPGIIKLKFFRLNKDGVLKYKKYIGSSYSHDWSEAPNSLNSTKDGGFIVASTFQFLSNTHPYSIIKIDSTGCDTVEHWCKSVALGVNKFTELSGFDVELFPNPANDFINIRIDAPLDKQFTAKICDLTGKEIETLELLATSNNELKTTAYAPGIYFINVFYEGKAVETKKLVMVK